MAEVIPRFEPEHVLARLPTKPGVYRMLDQSGAVLYVGKARNLKSRVTSYFRASGLTAKTLALVARIHGIEVTVTASETAAATFDPSEGTDAARVGAVLSTRRSTTAAEVVTLPALSVTRTRRS